MPRIGTALSFVVVALLSLIPAPGGWADHPGSARPRDILALQDDLNSLDDSLRGLEPRQGRYEELQERVDAVREDVIWLKVQMRRHADDRGQGLGASRAEVDELRRRIASLRDDVEEAQGRRYTGASSRRLPSGTEIQVRLDQDLSSRTARLEDRVEASTVEAVQLDGRTVIPAGTTVSGVVSEVLSAGRGQKDGRLKLEFDSLTLDGGTRTSIRSRVVSVAATRSGGSTTKKAGLGALLGGVLGGIIHGTKGALIGAVVGAGGAVVGTKGENVDLPEGTLLTLRLDEPIMVARR